MEQQRKEINNTAAFYYFIENADTKRTSRHLRNILLDYLEAQRNCLPLDFDSYLIDLRFLFEFLDSLEQ